MYLLEVWFNLTDKAVDEPIDVRYAIEAVHGVDFTQEGASNAMTLLDFRHLLERRGLQKAF
jgi:IS5 family transposase